MKLKQLSAIVLQQTLQRHNQELAELVELLRDNDNAPSSAIINAHLMQWETPPSTEIPE